jgi:hypothetical protein
MAAISAWYLVLLIPAALFVVLAWLLSRQRWDKPKGKDGTSPPGP